MRRATLALVLLLAACASEEAPPPASPPPPGRAQLVTATTPAPAPPPAQKVGTVLFSVSRADLSSEVLPLFEQQVGVKVLWIGEPRQVSLRLTQPMPWPDALDLVCQFTSTHPTRDYQGRLVLKDGWGGDLGDGDLKALAAGGHGSVGTTSGGGSAAGGGGGGSGPAWNGGGGAAPAASGHGIPQPTGAYSGGAEAGQLLRGVNMNNSGGR
jgi:hypothetical protein